MSQQHDLTSPDGVKGYLQTNGYPSCVSVDQLSGGSSGFTFRAHLRKSDSQPSSIVVKHVENYAARLPDFKIGQQRMVYEAKALEFLGKLPANTEVAPVRVAHLLAFDSDNHTLIMEDAGNVPSLKSWLTANSPRDQVTSVGQGLGSYLAHVHNMTATDSEVKEAFGSNVIGKNVSSSVYYGGLPAAARKFGYTKPFITAAAKFAEQEVLTANEVLTLGDFWTGNVLVSAPQAQGEPKLTVHDLELAKPGTAAFDIGQMGAEMLCLARFRSGEQGSLLLQSFFQTYKAERKAEVNAAAVAIRIGAHLFMIMPMAWQAEAGESKVKEVLEEGFELLKMGWEKDELALKQSIVGVLMD
ncbi:hypothetical protein Q7P35_003774 [Cladosporium inversicolor]